MKAEDYAVQAKLQRDIAWFNPLHEDNYYIGAAMLPWNGELDAAQYVLRKASDGADFRLVSAVPLRISLLPFSPRPGDRREASARGGPAGQQRAGPVGAAESGGDLDREGLPDRQRRGNGRGDGRGFACRQFPQLPAGARASPA
jgi:hypothetical protein